MRLWSRRSQKNEGCSWGDGVQDFEEPLLALGAPGQARTGVVDDDKTAAGQERHRLAGLRQAGAVDRAAFERLSVEGNGRSVAQLLAQPAMNSPIAQFVVAAEGQVDRGGVALRLDRGVLTRSTTARPRPRGFSAPRRSGDLLDLPGWSYAAGSQARGAGRR